MGRQSCAIRRCDFSDQSLYGVTVNLDGSVKLGNYMFRHQNVGVFISCSPTTVSAQRCVFEDVQDCSVFINSSGPETSIHECNLAKGARYIVRVQVPAFSYPIVRLDFSDNYWGTDDACPHRITTCMVTTGTLPGVKVV